MSALPCPACGFDMGPAMVEPMRNITKIREHRKGEPPPAIFVRCHQCDSRSRMLRPLSPDGVGPERLVPVEVGA